jgi:hypothetical protein
LKRQLAFRSHGGFDSSCYGSGIRGWIGYYGRYTPSALAPTLRYVNQTLLAWAMRKFKRLRGRKIHTSRVLQRLVKDRAKLFVHWQLGMMGTFA